MSTLTLVSPRRFRTLRRVWFASASSLRRNRKRLQRWGARIALYRARSRQRQQLAALSAHQLKDMGISAYDADMEARKPFWQD